MNNLIGIEQLNKEEIIELLELTKDIEDNPKKYLKKLEDKSLATLFFQDSTRTRLSSSLAMQKLGGKVIELDKAKFNEEMGEEESFEDIIKVVGDYVDIICLRHSDEKSPNHAGSLTKAKIINCGNGRDQHPTQALLDLYTIWKEFKRLHNLNIVIVGDLKHSRSAHSLFIALSFFEKNKIKLISPNIFKMPKRYFSLIRNEIDINKTEKFELENEDIIYMAGFPIVEKYDNYFLYDLSIDKVKNLKETSIIMCPLPRIGEIKKEVDALPQARYFQQSKNGIFVRMAIFIKLLEGLNE
ncbi:MAG: aspartate carbamoyltransferase [Candidatus Woesearchaeota archaeon]